MISLTSTSSGCSTENAMARGDGVGGNRNPPEVLHPLLRQRVGDALGQLRLGDTGRNHRHPDVAAHLLAQPF
jgi:hypothetical protein